MAFLSVSVAKGNTKGRVCVFKDFSLEGRNSESMAVQKHVEIYSINEKH
jgi:hypothetical protein